MRPLPFPVPFPVPLAVQPALTCHHEEHLR